MPSPESRLTLYSARGGLQPAAGRAAATPRAHGPRGQELLWLSDSLRRELLIGTGRSVEYRSQQGGEEDANLITLCAWHHRRAQHTERSIRIRKQPLRFELGLRRDGGPPLAIYGAGDLRC